MNKYRANFKLRTFIKQFYNNNVAVAYGLIWLYRYGTYRFRSLPHFIILTRR